MESWEQTFYHEGWRKNRRAQEGVWREEETEMFVGGTGAVNGECGSHMKPAEKIQGQKYETTQTSQII